MVILNKNYPMNSSMSKTPKSRWRRFYNNELNHIYQRQINGFNIFYDIEDYLVYYTLFAVLCRCYDIIAIGLCLMPNHIHMLVKAGSRKVLAAFMDHCTSAFAKEHNFHIGRSGGVFRKRYGSAPKIGLKIIKTAIAYLFNNPVEKHLCSKAEEYRWNFLAYAVNPCPFSRQMPIRKMRYTLRKAIEEVRRTKAMNMHLKYYQLRRMFDGLNNEEKEILTDYIISSYNPFSYDALINHFGSYENMLVAIHSNTGSEYEINEEFDPSSDAVYEKMKEIIRADGIKPIRKVTILDIEEKMRLYHHLKARTNATNHQICRFLHIMHK